MSGMRERYLAMVERALEGMGGTHTFQDILEAIEDGRMQSFAINNTWAITQVIDFPRKRVLEIFLVVGDMAEAEKLHDEVLAYGKSIGCQVARTFGRDGWAKQARARGWTEGQRVFLKEL